MKGGIIGASVTERTDQPRLADRATTALISRSVLVTWGLLRSLLEKGAPLT